MRATLALNSSEYTRRRREVRSFRVPLHVACPSTNLREFRYLSPAPAQSSNFSSSHYSTSSSFQLFLGGTGGRREMLSRPECRVGNGRTIGNVRFFTMGTCFFAATILKGRRKSSVCWNRRVEGDAQEETHFGGVAGSRRALESCRFGT